MQSPNTIRMCWFDFLMVEVGGESVLKQFDGFHHETANFKFSPQLDKIVTESWLDINVEILECLVFKIPIKHTIWEYFLKWDIQKYLSCLNLHRKLLGKTQIVMGYGANDTCIIVVSSNIGGGIDKGVG